MLLPGGCWKGPRCFSLVFFSLAIVVASGCVAAEGEISFESLLVPQNQVLSGGPPKDGIPALTNPRVVSAAEARWLQPSERVIGVSIGGEHRAYPLKILNWHELINDTVGGEPIVITYCPLCDSA